MQFVEIVSLLSGVVVVGFCLFLIGLAVVIATTPSLAERFLRSFASSMWYPELFRLFGWFVVVTAVGLLLIPWQLHHKFGTWVIPLVIRHMRLFALGAAALGAFILYGVSRAVIS